GLHLQEGAPAEEQRETRGREPDQQHERAASAAPRAPAPAHLDLAQEERLEPVAVVRRGQGRDVAPAQQRAHVSLQHVAHANPPRFFASSVNTRPKASRARCNVDSQAFSLWPPRAAISAVESSSTYFC